MKSVKKILCVLLTLTIAASCVAIGSMQSSAVTDESAVGESQSGLAQETVQGSAILHCFCWSYNTIKQKLPEIAAAGYTAIQTSPVQPPKDYLMLPIIHGSAQSRNLRTCVPKLNHTA